MQATGQFFEKTIELFFQIQKSQEIKMMIRKLSIKLNGPKIKEIEKQKKRRESLQGESPRAQNKLI